MGVPRMTVRYTTQIQLKNTSRDRPAPGLILSAVRSYVERTIETTMPIIIPNTKAKKVTLSVIIKPSTMNLQRLSVIKLLIKSALTSSNQYCTESPPQ